MQLEKEDTQRSNLKSKILSKPNSCPESFIFFCVCSIGLLVKYNLILRYEFRVKNFRASSWPENFI